MNTEQGIARINGTELAYEVAGAGQSVVLVHGFGLDRRLWDDQFDFLATSDRVLRYDLRGFGESAVPELGEAYTHFDDLAALLDLVGMERPVLVGLSLGGWVCVEFALTHPQRVAGLVLIDAALREHRYSAEVRERIAALYRMGREWGSEAALRRWLDDPLFAVTNRVPERRARLEAMITAYSGWHLLHDDPHPPMVPPAIQRLREVAAPTLVVIGGEDVDDYHEIAKVIAAGVQRAVLLEIRGAGHLANLDASAVVNHVLERFLASVDSS
jgi:3-oxoadipate enol-lactonase